MSNDKTTLADVQPGGKVRLATVPFDRAHDLLGDAYNAGTQGIGYSQQAMELHDAIIPVQPFPSGQGDDSDLLAGLRSVEDYLYCGDSNPVHTATVRAAINAIAARQPVGATCDGTRVDPGGLPLCRDCGGARQPVDENYEIWAQNAENVAAELTDERAIKALRFAARGIRSAARHPVRIYGCCAQPEGELHTAGCPNMRHRAARQPVAQPITVEAVAEIFNDPEFGLNINWLLENGIGELQVGDVLMVADRAITDEDGSGEVYAAPTSQAVDQGPTFQAGVAEWMGQCFLPSLYSNMTERGDRLLEEVLELLQAHGYDSARVPPLVDYVFGRPVGEPAQEVGGVMVTLAAYCNVAGLSMQADGQAELDRINQPEVMARIRAKQEAKNGLHIDTPLPGNAGQTAQGVDLGQFRASVLHAYEEIHDGYHSEKLSGLLALIDSLTEVSRG